MLISVNAQDRSANWHRMDNFGDINSGNIVDSASEFVVLAADGESTFLLSVLIYF